MSFTEDVSDGREQLLDEVLANYLKAAQEGRSAGTASIAR